MNVNCIICSDLFTPFAETYTTTCGHIFHYGCLVQWLERSKTCPQCRCKVTEKTIHRLFFNVQSSEGICQDVGALQSKIDSVSFQLQMKEKDCKVYIEKHEKAKSQNAALRLEIKTLEDKTRTHESVMHALKEQIHYFKHKSKDAERLSEEVQRLKDRLKAVDDVQLVLGGSKDQVNEMLRHNRDPESLALMVSSLKKELIDTDRKRHQLKSKLLQTHNEMGIYRKERDDLKVDNANLRIDVAAHLNCEAQRKHLKSKLSSLESKLSQSKSRTATPDTSINRIIHESPAPHRGPHLPDDLVDLTAESPTVDERVKRITDSDSPYLPVKSGSLSTLMNARFAAPTKGAPVAPLDTYTQYDRHKKLGETRGSSPDVSYNGLGGRSKVDKYPTGGNPEGVLKRAKSGSYLPSAKFRKLTGNPRSKKIEELSGKPGQEPAGFFM